MLVPVLGTATLRLLCQAGEVEELLAELAMHKLDVVRAGPPAPYNPNLRLSSELLANAPVDWHGPTAQVSQADVDDFPQSLGRLPMLPPTGAVCALVLLQNREAPPFDPEGC